MFLKRKEASEILRQIKNHIPLFEKDKILTYTKWAVPRIYELVKYSDIKKLKSICSEKIIEKMEKSKLEYRINDDIDRVVVQYASLHDFIYKNDDEMYIQVYTSVYLHDNVLNNGPLDDELLEQIMKSNLKNKYWNDIWIVTYGKKKRLINVKSANCSNCGAIMKFDRNDNLLKCEHCKNIVFGTVEDNDDWEIVDIQKI